jgi:hypothetical protein
MTTNRNEGDMPHESTAEILGEAISRVPLHPAAGRPAPVDEDELDPPTAPAPRPARRRTTKKGDAQ